MLYIDIETRSRCDLRERGVYNYANDPTTEVLCIAYAGWDGEVHLWRRGLKLPIELVTYQGQIRAHNAAFERLVLTRRFGLNYTLEQFYCTAAMARANCFPGALEDVARFAGTDMKKDHKGAALIRKLCVPQADGKFSEDPALLAELYEYCRQDVRTMRAIDQALRPLTDTELADYHVNERINDRGVKLDVDLARAAIRYSDAELGEAGAVIRQLTDGAVTSTRSPRLRAWVWERLSERARKIMIGPDGRQSLDKTVRFNLLRYAEDYPDEIACHVADAIQLADDVAASSTAKFGRLVSLSDMVDHRVRGAFVFAGGSATGRASSYGAQVHNFPRKSAKEADACRADMVQGLPIAPTHGVRTTDVLKGLLRPALIAHAGHSLVVADWSSIEARVTPWASASPAGERKLDLFRAGADVYKHNAAATFGVSVDDVTSDQRQVGKVQELSCGFGGGVGAFSAMGRVYGIAMPEPESERMVKAWRRANAWASVYWSDLEQAYTRAMRNPGVEFRAGRVTYMFDGLHLWYALPSGRVLCYPYARLDEDGVSYAKAAWKPAADAKEWPRGRLWRGLACENITQAIAADILREALRLLEPDGVVLHVHDEIVIETRDAARVEAAMRLVMGTPPSWAEGLPLTADVKVMVRYGK
jgi:DNA polymerase